MAFTKLLLASMLAAVTLAQQDQTQIFQAFTPGQYNGQAVISGQYNPQPGIVLRSTPRLVPVKSGQPVLKRVRVAANPQSGQYLEQPIQYSQTVPAVSTYRDQGPVIPQQPHHQPAYYLQRSPTPQPQALGRPAAKIIGKNPQELEDEYPSDPNPQYNFAFDVKDDDLTNYQNRQEERDGGVIKGSYSVVDPDGYVRTVTYTADSKNGFQAKVTREPTDVKVKFPVPTEAPAKGHENSPRAPQQYAYAPVQQVQPQQYQPQAQYTQPQQVFAGQGGRFPQQQRIRQQ